MNTDDIYSHTDNFGGSLSRNSGKARFGNNFRLYLEAPTGRVFHGNQYVNTSGLQNFGSKITKLTQPLKAAGRRVPVIAMVFEAVEIVQDGDIFGHNVQKQTIGVVGSIGGGIIGVWRNKDF